ncbi:MAG: hypothetical protein OXH49_04080 [Gemmatimonadetes bacterium]|nr:hypothetical protein [Gemmatimonadota bacterium]
MKMVGAATHRAAGTELGTRLVMATARGMPFAYMMAMGTRGEVAMALGTRSAETVEPVSPLVWGTALVTHIGTDLAMATRCVGGMARATLFALELAMAMLSDRVTERAAQSILATVWVVHIARVGAQATPYGEGLAVETLSVKTMARAARPGAMSELEMRIGEVRAWGTLIAMGLVMATRFVKVRAQAMRHVVTLGPVTHFEGTVALVAQSDLEMAMAMLIARTMVSATQSGLMQGLATQFVTGMAPVTPSAAEVDGAMHIAMATEPGTPTALVALAGHVEEVLAPDGHTVVDDGGKNWCPTRSRVRSTARADRQQDDIIFTIQ